MKINGKIIAEQILEDLKSKVQTSNLTPHLAIILVGNDPASKAYVRQKILTAEKIGAKTTVISLESRVQNSELNKIIKKLNNDNSVHGIIVQQPLPSHIDLKQITNAIDPKKDVDGFHANSKFQSPIAMAVLKILEKVYTYTPRVEPQLTDWLKNQKIAVVGKGETGGEPIIQSLGKSGIRPFIIDSKTLNPSSITKNADIIISAVGKPSVLNKNLIKKQSILISIGLSKGTDGKLHGDYDEEEIKDTASFYTPTPGGVGPVNVAMLLKNLLTACENFSR